MEMKKPLVSSLDLPERVSSAWNQIKFALSNRSTRTWQSTFQDYIRQSKLGVDLMTTEQSGNWRTIFVRSNQAGEVMAKVTFHPQNLTAEEIDAEKDKLRDYFQNGPGTEANLSSLYFLASAHTYPSEPVNELLFGKSYIEESFGGYQFQLGPDTFFQSNVQLSEKLVDIVKKYCRFKKQKPILLDICCGIGFYSILLHQEVRKSFAIDANKSAIRDAKEHAKRLGIDNIHFYDDKLEVILPVITENLEMSPDNVTVILNPGRAGVSTLTVNALMQCEKVKNIVYISCQPEGNALNNLVRLCYRRNRKPTELLPFSLIAAIPVDMFPNTHCCEHVFVFQRNKARRN
jgi:tRNA/tmRNA/rRNA uracil-C5-methylase (TrmA/RlmC/RlmD family)